MSPNSLGLVSYVVEHYHVADSGMNLILRTLVGGIKKLYPKCFVVLLYSSVKYQDRLTGSKNPKEPYVDPVLLNLEPRMRSLRQIMNSIETSTAKKQQGMVVDMPALGYSSKIYSRFDNFVRAAEKRKAEKLRYLMALLKFRRNLVHHIHNPTLMKNPLETYANYLLAMDLIYEPYIQIRHICDLTEDTPAREDLRRCQKHVAGQQTEKKTGK